MEVTEEEYVYKCSEGTGFWCRRSGTRQKFGYKVFSVISSKLKLPLPSNSNTTYRNIFSSNSSYSSVLQFLLTNPSFYISVPFLTLSNISPSQSSVVLSFFS